MSRKNAPVWVQKEDALNHQYEYQLGQNLRQLREARGYTQEQVAMMLQLYGCDITRSALAKIEVAQRHLYPDEIYAFHLIYRAPLGTIFPPFPEEGQD